MILFGGEGNYSVQIILSNHPPSGSRVYGFVPRSDFTVSNGWKKRCVREVCEAADLPEIPVQEPSLPENDAFEIIEG